jgi:hypothetical protein
MIGKIIKTLGKTAKRALTNDGGGVLTVTNESGQFDMHAAGAIILRLLATILTGLAIYYMNELGLPGAEIMQDGRDALEAAE